MKKQQTILIVEDEAEIREGIRILLSGESYTILEAENGEQALRKMNPQVDLVILDVMMPGISGLRVCEEIRKTSTVPILFLTAKAQESDKLIGLTAGGDDYLVKPFSYAELIARVKALLRRYCVYQGKGQPGATYENDTLSVCGACDYIDAHAAEAAEFSDPGLFVFAVGNPAAADAAAPVDFLRPGHLREHLERALLSHFQRHGNGAYPKAAHEN